MRRTIAAGAFVLALTAAVSAHRLDEYLQAARLDIARDRITLEMDLTPGVSVASQVLADVDTNQDGVISRAEADAYAARVLSSLSLTVDGRRERLQPVEVRVPEIDAMRQGVGAVRIRALAQLDGTRGSHELMFQNGHRPDIAVYLANALVPRDTAVEIERQDRDALQRELRIAYRVRSQWTWRLSWTGAAALVMAGLIGLRRAPVRWRARPIQSRPALR